jgi:hypothetical protein
MRRCGAGLKIGEDGGDVFGFLWRFAHALKYRAWGTRSDLRFIQIGLRPVRPAVETGLGAAIQLLDFGNRQGWFFLYFDLYPGLLRSLFFYFFEGLSRGVDDGTRREIA